MTFKEIKPGLFRYKDFVTYVKLVEPTEKYNAVMIASGIGIKIGDDEEVIQFD